MTLFDRCHALFNADDMQKLASSDAGLLWLKLKSVSRKALLEEFERFAGLPETKAGAEEKFRKIFGALSRDAAKSRGVLNNFIKQHAPAYSRDELEGIASELHKMQAFSWGGDYSNALDRFLVDRYVKKIRSYERIAGMLQTEIPRAVVGYVLCSWYNHWSTILIENIFRLHRKVLPAVGNVKKVDFFVDDVPFDLKTTYLPANFVEQRRKEEGLSGELAELKRIAKERRIPYDAGGRAKDAAYEISERIRTGDDADAQSGLSALWNFRKRLLRECRADPGALIQNLYEQQGAMRFDASNRLFVVLVDARDFDNSWKLKRNPALLQKSIHAYLDSFSKDSVRRVRFRHKAKSGEFAAMSDVICVVAGE